MLRPLALQVWVCATLLMEEVLLLSLLHTFPVTQLKCVHSHACPPTMTGSRLSSFQGDIKKRCRMGGHREWLCGVFYFLTVWQNMRYEIRGPDG